MKRLTLFILSLTCFIPLKASHLLGGQITYVAQDSLNYKVYATLYRDCDGTNMGTGIPLILRHDGKDTSINGSLLSRKDVTGRVANCYMNSTCNGGSYFGIEEFVFVYDLNLSGVAACDLRLSWRECCRISTLTTGGANQNYYMETLLNKCVKGGSSSLFFDLPISPLLKYNAEKIISFTGQDSGNFVDSVSYELSAPLLGRDSSITYNANYSYLIPCNFSNYPNANGLNYPTGFRLNQKSGNLLFRPTQSNQVFTTSVKIKCYKRIGDSMTWVSTIHKNYTGIVTYSPSVSPFRTYVPNNEYDIHQFPKICAGDTLNLYINWQNVTGATTNRQFFDSRLAIPHYDTVNAFSNGQKQSIIYYPDSTHIKYGPYYHIFYANDSLCATTQNWMSVGRGFVVVPEIKATHHPLITVRKGCNSFSLRGVDTNDLRITKTEWTYNNVTKTGDSCFFLARDTGWQYFTVRLDNGGGCPRSFLDSFYMDSISNQHPALTYSTIETCTLDSSFIQLPANSRVMDWFLDQVDTTPELLAPFDTLLPTKDRYVSITRDSSFCYFSDTLNFRTRNTPYLFPQANLAHCVGNFVDLEIHSQIDSGAGILPVTFYWNGQQGSLDTAFYPNTDMKIGRTLVDSIGCTYTDSVEIYRNSPFTINAGVDTSICIGGELILNGRSSLHPWNVSYAEWVDVDSGSIYTARVYQSDYFIYEVKRNDGCVLRDTVNVMVDEFFEATITGNAILCFGDTAQFSYSDFGGMEPYRIEWKFQNSSDTADQFSIPSQASTFSEWIHLHVVDSLYCVSEDSMLLYNRMPAFQLASDSTFLCAGQFMTFHADSLTDLTPDTYSWKLNGQFSGSLDSFVFTNPDPGETDTLVLTLIDTFGCVSTRTQLITINPFTSSIIAHPLVCGGDSLWIDADLNGEMYPLIYDWQINTQPFSDSQFFFTPVPGQSYAIVLTTEDGYGCRTSDSFFFTTTNFMVDILGDSVLCLHEEKEFLPSPRLGPAPFQYQWELNGSQSSGNTLILHNKDFSSGLYEIHLKATDSNTCTAFDTFFVKINKFSHPPFMEDGLCLGDSLVFNPLDTGGYGNIIYSWSKPAQVLSTHLFSYYGQSVAKEKWYFNAVDEENCKVYDSLEFEVRELKANLNGSRLSCGVDSLFLNVNPRLGYTPYAVSWFRNGLLIDSLEDIVIVDTNKGSSYLEVTVTDRLGCRVELADSIHFRNRTQIRFLYDLVFCATDEEVLLDTLAEPAGGQFRDENGANISIFDPSQQVSGTHWLTYRSGDPGCEESDSIQAYVHAAPSVNFVSNVQTGYDPLTVQFFATVIAQYPQLFWSFGDGNLLMDSLSPVHTYRDTGLFTVSVVLRDSVCETGMQRVAYILVLDSTLNSNRLPEDQGLLVYPNPFQDQIQIVSESAIEKLELFDAKGTLVEYHLTDRLLSYTLQTHGLTPGIYLLRILTNSGTQAIRLEKK